MNNIQETAQSLANCLPASGPIVVYGAPGVGKTTLIQAMMGYVVGQKPLVIEHWDGNTDTAQQIANELPDRAVLLVTDQVYTGNWTSVHVQRTGDDMTVYMRFKVWEK